MHLCLSSGTTPRYREDVLRALAMPSGTDLQFRYRTKWLSPQTKAGLGEVRNDRAIIAYIDQSDVQKTPLIIPCRFARIVGAISHGTTVSVTLRVEGFALSSDLARTNASLRTLATGVPDWNNGRAAGYWWTDIANPPDAVEESYKLSAWESIVEQLYGHEFAHDDVFYTVVGICDADGGLQESDDPKTMPHFVAADDGRLVLNAEKDYEIRAYHYHPKSAPTNRMSFAVESLSPLIRFSTATRALIDSPYDLKRFRFRTVGTVSDELPVISVKSQALNGDRSPAAPGVDLLTRIKGQRWKFAGYGAVIGVLIGLAPAVAAIANSGLSDVQRGLIAVLSIAAGIGAGEVAAFNLKKL